MIEETIERPVVRGFTNSTLRLRLPFRAARPKLNRFLASAIFL